MRKTRWVLLVLLVSAIGVVISGYFAAQKQNLLSAPVTPTRLPPDLHSAADNWTWSHSSGDRPVIQLEARDFRQIKDTSRVELGEVELKIFSKEGDTYDWIRSKKAEFDQPAERLYSEGEVIIVLGLPAGAPPPPGKRYVEIRTSGLAYDNKTGVSSTDRPVHFQFEDGEGRSVGALYDSANRYLRMSSQAELSTTTGMQIRAGELHYYEAEQKIEMRPWSSIERGGQGVQAAASTVYLEQGNLKKVEAAEAKGWNSQPGREVRFGGDWLEVVFTPHQTVETASGIGNAELVSRSASGVTRANGGRMDLEFTTAQGTTESVLSVAHIREKARVENVPATRPSGTVPETKLLTAEAVKLVMRPGGEEIQMLETLSSGQLEFIPSQPSQWKRTLVSDRMSAQYAPGNHIETLRALGKVHLRSDPPAAQPGAKPPAQPPPPRLTWSDDLQAFFDPQSGQLRELRQWSNFRYQEGVRQATAGGARFEAAEDRVLLDNAARVWDETTLTTADLLVLHQKQDRLEAQGKVTSTHQDKPAAAGSEALFSRDRPLHATAQRLESREQNRLLDYRGSARLWQDGNSIQADEISLDREAKTLSARGRVVSVLVEQEQRSEAGQTGKPAAPKLVTISADSLVYTDQDRRAFYTGRVVMRRERMTVRGAELEAFLRAKSEVKPGESQLERAFAKGRVEILEAASDQPGGGRRAYAEQAEYFSGEQKVVLRGGMPTIEQPGRGFTRGAELTYYLDDDRLLVSGRPGVRSQTYQKLKRN